jgi:hypothetical protein
MNHPKDCLFLSPAIEVFDDEEDGGDPLAGLTNAFDAAIVFALAFMVALVQHLHVPALLQAKDYTVITNPGQPNMEIIVKEGKEIKHYEATDEMGVGYGELLGKAYRLPDGRVVYVPADKEKKPRGREKGGRSPPSEKQVMAYPRLRLIRRRVCFFAPP